MNLLWCPICLFCSKTLQHIPTSTGVSFLSVVVQKPCNTYQPYILYGFLQHIPTSIEVYFLSAFVQKPCNTYQPYRGVHFVCFCSEALQHIPNSIGVYFLSVLFKNPATFTSPIGVSFLSVFVQKPCNI